MKNSYVAPITEWKKMFLASNLLSVSPAGSDIDITTIPADPLYPGGGD
jgi:hypothetical protein